MPNSEPTPEERAVEFCDRLGEFCSNVSVYPARFVPALSRAIRAAVAAERERCASLTGWQVRELACETPECMAQPGEACQPDGQGRSHANRWRAAIRALGEDEDAEE